MVVRTRIAPSPTGFAHIGTIYQVLFDYAYAKKFDGQFIVRIEDTDRTRFVEGAEEVIYDSLEWFKLEPDESPIKGGPYAPYRSSDRLDIYKKYALELIEKKHAYYCFCTKERLEKMREEQQKLNKAPKYDKQCLSLSKEVVDENLGSGVSFVIRLNVPENEKIIFNDAIAGDIAFDSNTIDDQVLIKSDGYPTYHMAVVVDDYLMKISHIFRGTEWIPSTPKHILLYRFLGWGDQIPVFAHLPLILNSDSPGKLSKRQSAASVSFYKEEGYLPEAILNYLSNIVWNHPEGKEIYSLDEFTKLFEIKDLQPKGAKFDLKKLDWMNGEYIRLMSDEELVKRLEEFNPKFKGNELLIKLVPLSKERIKTLKEFFEINDFMFNKPAYNKEILSKLKVGDINKSLEATLEKLESMEKHWSSEKFEQTFRELANELDIPVRDMFQLIRVTISGKLITPPLFESIEILGEDETIKRVKEAKEFFN